MSRDDFERCTPIEFYEIYGRWAEDRRMRERGEWERARTVVYASLQPYMKRKSSPHDVLPLPWDEEEREKKEREELSREDIETRFEAARKRRGLK